MDKDVINRVIKELGVSPEDGDDLQKLLQKFVIRGAGKSLTCGLGIRTKLLDRGLDREWVHRFPVIAAPDKRPDWAAHWRTTFPRVDRRADGSWWEA